MNSLFVKLEELRLQFRLRQLRKQREVLSVDKMEIVNRLSESVNVSSHDLTQHYRKLLIGSRIELEQLDLKALQIRKELENVRN